MADQNDTRERRKAVRGLRELADWLEATPDAPLAYYPSYGRQVTGEEMLRIAASLGFTRQDTDNTYVVVARHFGPVEYRLQCLRSELTAAPAPLPPVPDLIGRGLAEAGEAKAA